MMAGWLPHSVCLPQLDSQIGWLDERRELITEAAGMILHEEQCPTACLFPAMACVVGEAIAEARRGWPPRSGHTSWLDSFAVSRAPFAVGPLSRLLLGRWTRGRAREPSVSLGGRMNRTRHPHWLTSYFTAARACSLARSLPLERRQTKGGDDAVRRHGTPGRLIKVPRLVSRYQASSTRMLQLRCRRHGGP